MSRAALGAEANRPHPVTWIKTAAIVIQANAIGLGADFNRQVVPNRRDRQGEFIGSVNWPFKSAAVAAGRRGQVGLLSRELMIRPTYSHTAFLWQAVGNALDLSQFPDPSPKGVNRRTENLATAWVGFVSSNPT